MPPPPLWYGLIMSLVFHKVQQQSKWRSSSPTVIIQTMHKGRPNSQKEGYPKGFLQRAFVEATTWFATNATGHSWKDNTICLTRGGHRLDVGIYVLKIESPAPVTSLHQLEPWPTRIKPVRLAGADFQTWTKGDEVLHNANFCNMDIASFMKQFTLRASCWWIKKQL